MLQKAGQIRTGRAKPCPEQPLHPPVGEHGRPARHSIPLDRVKVVDGVFFKETLDCPHRLTVGDSYRFPLEPGSPSWNGPGSHPGKTVKPGFVEPTTDANDGVARQELALVLMSESGAVIHGRVLAPPGQQAVLVFECPVRTESDYVLIDCCPRLSDALGRRQAFDAAS
jgi:hypothetical protein